MEDARAKKIINLRDTELAKQATFRSLWQETADLMFPRENQITNIQAAGTDKSKNIFNTTAVFDSQDMASGLSAAFIPSGQLFFGLKAKDRELNENDDVRRYLSIATEITHDELFESNFMLQFNETLRSLVVFGTGNLYSEFDTKWMKLNFKDWDISFYQFLEDSHGNPDTILLSYTRTARQLQQEFIESGEYENPNLGTKIIDALKEEKTENKPFKVIFCVRPRKKRNALLSDYMNWPFEAIYVNEEEKEIIAEIGFQEFPFAIARWMKSSTEKHGRGQGTECLASVRRLQQMERDFSECGNKWNNPPKEVLEHFEGTVRVTPGALNFVKEKGTIRAIEQTALGNFPITKEMIELKEQEIHRAFYKDVFAPLTGLKGDRRTTVEIYKLFEQAAKKLAMPLYRLMSELLTPNITRDVLLLIRNGKIPYPPPELQGEGFGIEYISELALALRNQQANAFQQFAAFVGELDVLFPGEKPSDNIHPDRATRRMGRAFGVNEEDMTTEEERTAKRQARAEQLRQQQMAQMAQVASKSYKEMSGAAEEGSPSAELQEAITGT